MSLAFKKLDLQKLDLKFVGEGMTFSGYASVFGQVDSYGDTIDPNAYDLTLKDRVRPVRMRWNHYGPVIGKWLRMTTDKTGLFVEGELTPGHSKAIDTYASLKHGAVDGLSIGYIAKSAVENPNGTRLLKDIELVEISIVEEPADINATVSSIKSAIEQAKSIREIEATLRDSAGLSRLEACAVVSRIKSVIQSDFDNGKKEAQEIAQLFKSFNGI
jgi:HK97 family phage prohead protease